MFDIHQSIFDPDGEIDSERVESYIDGSMREFVASAEAQPVFDQYGNGGWPAMMMEYAIDYLGVTLPEMSLANFNEVVFDLFPRKVSTEPESAPSIVAELRAFWHFLQREFGLANAKPILASLTDAAARRLEKALANPANFGMAKSFVMRGIEAGFDMTTEKGIAEFTALYNSRLPGGGASEIDEIPPAFPFVELPPSPLSPKQRADKRKKRKAQRQARKRNRK
ncbi:MAG TPA: hypothetical protein VN688_20100 [Gemmataceae bacterium]|nr:hypothetical protein [Gemmataceae bacterium]